MAITQRWTRGLSVLVTSLLITIGVIFGISRAQQLDSVNLSVSPQVIEKSANPGDSTTDIVRVTNNATQSVEIDASALDIEPQGEEGSYIPTLDKTTYSLSQWITVSPSNVVLTPGETQDFKVDITYPANAEPGGHFATVVFETVPPPPGEGSAAQVKQELALPVILAKVSGDIQETAELVEFKSTKSFWTNQKPITFETRIKNTGNVHFKPSGNIVVKNMFGNEVAKINLNELNVLPEYIRRVVTDWEDPGFAIGRYTADLTLVYGDDDTIITDTTSFIVFPYQTLLPAIILIGALLFVLIKFRSRVWMALKVLSGRS